MTAPIYTVTSFAWQKDIHARLAAGGLDSQSHDTILRKLSALAAFLDRSGLSVRPLTDEAGRVSEDFVLRSTDLTPLGLRVVRRGYEKWLRRAAKEPTDVRLLEAALEEEKKPNEAPEPTPGTVTPRADDPNLK